MLHRHNAIVRPPAAPDKAHAAAATCYRFGAFVLDTAPSRLTGPAGTVVLRRQALAVLRVLAEHAPETVELPCLLDAVWRRHAVSRTAVPQAIRAIRAALGDNAGRRCYVETTQGRGYRLAVPVERRVGALPWVDAAPPFAARFGRLAPSPGTSGLAANDDGRDASRQG